MYGWILVDSYPRYQLKGYIKRPSYKEGRFSV